MFYLRTYTKDVGLGRKSARTRAGQQLYEWNDQIWAWLRCAITQNWFSSYSHVEKKYGAILNMYDHIATKDRFKPIFFDLFGYILRL